MYSATPGGRKMRIRAIIIVTLFVLSCLAVVVPTAAGEGNGPAPDDFVPMASTKRVVLAEVYTGAWCHYCQFADGALQMVDSNYERDEWVILSFHYNDPMAFTDGDRRNSWYGSFGYPTVFIDGVKKREGAGNINTAYNNYVTDYNARSAIRTQLKMTVEGGIDGITGQGKVWVNMTAVDTPTLTNLKLHTVVFEDGIDYTGTNGVNPHDWVAREMLEGTDGTTISITSGQTKEFSYDIDVTSYADDYSKCGVIAFVQSHTNKEVLQAAYINVPVLPNVPPILENAQASPLEATEDEEITFKVWYRDTDDKTNNGPEVMKLIYKNATDGPWEKTLSIVPSADPWTVGKWLEYKTKLAPGVYKFRFNATDGESGVDTPWSDTSIVIVPRNKVPRLMEETYSPPLGDPDTEFTFEIKYRDLDNEAPTVAKIFINDVGHDMQTDSTGPWSNWVTYYHKTTLSVGSDHKFYFVFSDGEDQTRYPAAGASPEWIRGPDVEEFNYPPTMSSEQLIPQEGTRKTDFTFGVVYTDSEGRHPTLSTIFIDDVAQLMNAADSNYRTGARFTLRTKLGLGSHSYYFIFSDGKNPDVRYPTAGTFEGPTVTNLAPEAVIASPADGSKYSPEYPIPFTAVGSDDPENDVLTYLWTSSRDGEIGTQESFEKRLSEGMHTITLTVEDEYGDSHSVSLDLEVRANVPHVYIDEIRASVTDPVEQDMVKFTIVLGNDGDAKAEGITVRLFIDNVEVNSDATSVDVGATREVYFMWSSEAGDHLVRAEVFGDSEEMSISVQANTLPEATPAPEILDGTEAKFEPGETVRFKANADDANDDELTYEWDFGDGTGKVASRDPIHVYSESGTYTVTVKIIDARGGEVTKSFQVEIDKPKKDESPGFGAALVGAALLVALIGAATRRRW
jgi:hypothetical protein